MIPPCTLNPLVLVLTNYSPLPVYDNTARHQNTVKPSFFSHREVHEGREEKQEKIKITW
jgi:hypothetical protein